MWALGMALGADPEQYSIAMFVMFLFLGLPFILLRLAMGSSWGESEARRNARLAYKRARRLRDPELERRAWGEFQRKLRKR